MVISPAVHSLPDTPLRVLVIDAHPAVGLGLVRLVGVMPGLQVCGLASCGQDGLERAALVQPDVALVDADLPDDASVRIIKTLRACLPALRVVALGLYPDRRAAMLAAGAHAFSFKDAGFDALRAAMLAGSAAESVPERTPRSHTS